MNVSPTARIIPLRRRVCYLFVAALVVLPAVLWGGLVWVALVVFGAPT